MTDETKGADASREDELLAGLHRIEAAILKLVDVVGAFAERSPAPATPPRGMTSRSRTGGADAPAPPARPAQAPAGEPPLINVAPPLARHAAAQETAPRPDEVGGSWDPYADRHDIYVPPPEASIEEILTRIFEAALMESTEDTWALMSKLTHSSQLIGPRALDHFKAFAWTKARRTAPAYLDENLDPQSYGISHTEPAEITANTDRVKVFIRKSNGRMPAPIVLARDPKCAGAWRVAAISL